MIIQKPRAERSLDFDLHGIVGVRLENASSEDADVVRRQIGALEHPLNRAPDVIVRFEDEVPLSGLKFVEYGRTGFTEDGFFVLQSRKRPAIVRIAFDGIGGCCEIVCQRGVRAVPFLMAIVTMTALARGCVPLHASAFVHEGRGVLVTGWAKGGKTEALLAFNGRGAHYVGDEWILLTRDGRRMYGIPEFIRLQDWHLRQLPAVRRQVSVGRRAFFRAVRGMDRVHQVISSGAPGRFAPVKALGEALPALRRQLNVQLDPMHVFANAPHTVYARPETVCLMVSHGEPGIRVEPIDPKVIANRMAASNWYEQQPLIAAYLGYRFAFPERRSELLETAPAVQAEALSSALAGKEAWMVSHPYPCDLGALFDAMAPVCGDSRRDRFDHIPSASSVSTTWAPNVSGGVTA